MLADIITDSEEDGKVRLNAAAFLLRHSRDVLRMSGHITADKVVRELTVTQKDGQQVQLRQIDQQLRLAQKLRGNIATLTAEGTQYLADAEAARAQQQVPTLDAEILPEDEETPHE